MLDNAPVSRYTAVAPERSATLASRTLVRAWGPTPLCVLLKETTVTGLFLLMVVAPLTADAPLTSPNAPGPLVETDADSGAQVFVLGADERPADNIYGEQPYGDATGRRIAIRYYPLPDKPGGINILDLRDGANHEILSGKPPFPAFHAWGEWLYYAQTVEGKKTLRRCNYLTLQIEDVAELPPERGDYSYGTVSPDHRYYAVSVRPADGGPSNVHLLDLQTKQWSVLLDKPGYHAKHEQFSRDGRNRVLIQLNQMPDVKVVLLSELEIGGAEKRFPADQPYTLRPTGHEAWIGQTSGIFFSTAADATSKGNIWSAKVGDATAHAGLRGQSFWARQRLARWEVLDRRHRRERHSHLHRQLRHGPLPAGLLQPHRVRRNSSGATPTRT